jgi:hypothetical protein
LEVLAIVGFAAMGFGVVVACGGALGPSEPSPPVDGATPDDDAAGGGKTAPDDNAAGGGKTGGPRPGAGDAGDGDALASLGIPNDVNNCGGSGTMCSLANAVPKCTGAKCSIDSCLADFVDCDGDPTTGCECPSDSCAPDLPGKGNCGKRVFVTSKVTTGNLGGLAGADARCQAAAAWGTLPGVYKAWLSDAVASPATRFTRAVIPYRLVNGILIAKNWSDLVDGTIANPINIDERGGAAAPNLSCGGGAIIAPWTDTRSTGNGWGVLSQNCANWTDDKALVNDNSGYNDPLANVTDLGSGNSVTDWSAYCGQVSCANLAPLFCFQQ